MKNPGLRLLPALAVVAALTVSVAPADARHGAADGPRYGAPRVGACSRMGAHHLGDKSDSSQVVPCSRSHTAKVAGVVIMPKRVSYSDGFNALYTVVASQCQPKVNGLLGRTQPVRDSSAYMVVWFEPTKAQQAHGARWLSCSVVIPTATRTGGGVAPLPTDHRPMLPAKRLGDAVAGCLRTIGSGTWLTPCSKPHTFRATGTFTVSRRFPGKRALNTMAERRCMSRVRAARTFTWRYTDKITWNSGHDHVVVCYAKTKK
jgi:hypothetical protein